MYDTGDMSYNPPIPGTTLIGTNVRWLYITPYESPANVYVNGVYYGTVNYGDTLEINYTTPTDVVITSDNPVVAVAAYVDVNTNSGAYAYALMPPMSGDYIIPPSVASYAINYGAETVSEYYVVMDQQGNIIEQQNLPSQPTLRSYTTPVSVYVFRTFTHHDPWWPNVVRTISTATEIRPSSLESALLADVDVTGTHNRAISSMTLYGSGTIEEDVSRDGTVDNTYTFNGNFYVDSNDVNTITRYLATGQFSGSRLWFAAWNYEVGGAREFSTTTLLTAPQSTQPVASFTFSPSTPGINQLVTFDASSSYDPDGQIINYQWDFGDGSTASGITLQHTYSKPGTYIVTLSVTDNDNLTATTSRIVKVISGEIWQSYDSDNDGKINDTELLTAILDWLNNDLNDMDLLNIIMKWLIS